LKLTKYIEEQHENNTSAFARSHGVHITQAARWLKRNCVIIDGVIYCEASKTSKK